MMRFNNIFTKRKLLYEYLLENDRNTQHTDPLRCYEQKESNYIAN